MSSPATSEPGLTPIKFSRLTRRGVLLGLSGPQLRHGRHRRRRARPRSVRRRGRVGRPRDRVLRDAGLREGGWPHADRMGAHRHDLGVALHGRATRLPAARPQAPTRRDSRTPRRCCPAPAMGRRRDRGGHGPRPARRDPHRDRRGHAPRVRAPRSRRTRAASGQLGTSLGHRLPLRTPRLAPGHGTHPARVRQGPGRLVGTPWQPRRLLGIPDVRRPRRPRRTRWRTPRQHHLDLPRHEGSRTIHPSRRRRACGELPPYCDKRWPPWSRL